MAASAKTGIPQIVATVSSEPLVKMPRVLKKDLEAMVARLTKENSELKKEVEDLKKLVDDDGVFKWGVNEDDFTEWFTNEHGVPPSVDRYSQFVLEFDMMKTYDICELLQNGAMEIISDMNSGKEKGECNDCHGASGTKMADDDSGLCIDCREGADESEDHCPLCNALTNTKNCCFSRSCCKCRIETFCESCALECEALADCEGHLDDWEEHFMCLRCMEPLL